MNYQRIYNQIIDRAKNRILEGYSERHHILPRCLGGLNKSENLVKLTAREHFICHLLLAKIYKNKKYYYNLLHSVFRMSSYGRYNSKKYQWIKIEFSKLQSERKNGQKGYWLNKKRSLEDKNKMSIAKKDRIWISSLSKKEMLVSKEIYNNKYKKEGWLLGRNINFVTDEWKKKIGELTSKKMFGRIEIGNILLNKIRKVYDLEGYLQQENGWKIGRHGVNKTI